MPSQDSCSDIAGRVVPVIDRNRCEGKETCVRVCPYDVFEIATLSKEQRSGLSIAGRLKSWVHGGKQAFVVKPDSCHACKLCVEACPEDAIKLQPLAALDSLTGKPA